MIPLHYLWAKSINRAPGQFECDVTWFCFCLDFVRSHAQFGCCSIVCLRFYVAQQIKEVDCKMRTNWLSLAKGGWFEIRRPKSRGWKNFGRRWKREVGGPENWTIFMDVLCASSLILFQIYVH